MRSFTLLFLLLPAVVVLADKITDKKPDRTADIPLDPMNSGGMVTIKGGTGGGGGGGQVMAMAGAGPGVTKGPNLGMGGVGMGGGGSGMGGGEPIMERRRGLIRKAKFLDMKPQIIPLVLA